MIIGAPCRGHGANPCIYVIEASGRRTQNSPHALTFRQVIV